MFLESNVNNRFRTSHPKLFLKNAILKNQEKIGLNPKIVNLREIYPLEDLSLCF